MYRDCCTRCRYVSDEAHSLIRVRSTATQRTVSREHKANVPRGVAWSLTAAPAAAAAAAEILDR